MLYWRNTKQYQQQLLAQVIKLFPAHSAAFEHYDVLLSKLWLLDLDPAFHLLLPHYSSLGRPAMFQAEILRSFIAMAHFKEDSITHWVQRLRREPVLAIACGFDPDHVPGVGTFYDFLNRLWLGNEEKRPQKRRRKPRKLSKGQKLPPRHPGIVDKLVDKFLEGSVFPYQPGSLLQAIFVETAVMPSAEMGLLGDLKNLTLAGDGTCIQTGSSPHGKPT